ncbi:related to KAP114 - Member of the karyopherin-beta family, nuclear import [Melanopsichium pennsylvanicum]|uniref:Related to KAP114 - Member of the karyopherin-beta family, nuclear import n=2 Tax=Melanopsichium pennsylvanicum TaxID=63383 RepID=A0AAJ5C556_9BASI|nr:related to KAP114-Member of the karyopherin-beta family, nuclear import [Melanopsichium pennsylvanicum 4]SNX84223.1 related to KAP114 - Member of the karyopherin-beta family, nuclear import [Melanopsichium pennsylvanicum]
MEQHLAACLEATLSPDATVRNQGESQLASFQSPEHDAQGQAGLGFVRLLLDSSAPIHVRQSAGLALRKYITTRWSPYFDGFVGAAVDVSVKQQIRHTLLSGLADPIQKIRHTTSYVISTIAGPDYPDEYPDLLPFIQQLLQQGDANGLHGAMKLLCEFVRAEMDETQLMQVAKEILPALEQVLAQEDRYSAYIRARCILVFRQCLTTLFMVKGAYPDVIKQASQTLLPRWLDMMQILLARDAAQQLGQDLQQGWGTLALRNEIFKTLKVAAMFRAQFKSHLHPFMHSSLSNLVSLLPTFRQLYLSNSSNLDAPTLEEGDDDVACDIPSLACSILDFINEASRGDRCRDFFVSGGTGGKGQETAVLQQLIMLLLVYIDMTVDDEDNWVTDANAFIADEDEESLGYSLRIAAADLLGMLIEDFPIPALRCIGQQFHQLVQQANADRANGDQDWWKLHEGVLAAVGNNADAITDIVETQSEAKQALDLESIFSTIVLPNVGNDATTFLQGRAFVFASQFASSLPSELAVQFLDAAVNVIESDGASLPVKISAVRTVKNFYRHLPSRVVGPYAPRVVQKLGPLLTQASEDTLILIIETVQAVVVEETDSGEAASTALVEPAIIGEIVRAALKVWAPNARDIILLSVVSDLFESLAGSKQPGVPQVIVHESLPFLAAAIGSSLPGQADASADGGPSVIAETAVELAKSVLDGASPAALRGATGVLCPNLFRVLSSSEDRDVLQSGIECLTVLVKKCTQEIIEWKDAKTQASSVDLMLHMFARLLVPINDSESGGLAIGDLVVALLRKAGDRITHVVPQLLNAMVQRLATAQTATFIQSLIVPIAYLMHDNEERAKQVMDLLEAIQVAPSTEQPDAESGDGLEVLCKKWVDNVVTFQGFWSQRVSALALAKVLGSRRPFLTTTYVRGDMLPDNSGIIRTRSRAKTMPHQYSDVPMFAKIVKVLLKEWSTATQTAPVGASGNREGACTPETDDEDGEWDDEYEPRAGGQDDFAFLSDMLGPGGLDALQNDDDFVLEKDEDLKADPVYNMDLKIWLSQFLQHLAQTAGQASFQSQLSPYLNAEEVAMLNSIL